MAVSFHGRSNSCPSIQHPQAAHIDEQLTRLRSSEAASSSSSSSIYQRLSNLQDLHDSLDKMLRLSITIQALSQDQIEKLFDGSLRILDLCNVAKDALSQMKEGLKEIQSILRRKRGDLSAEVKKYLTTRKFMKKSFQKVLKNLKVSQNKENTDESLAVFGEAEAVTVALFGSLFSFMSGSKACAKWSLVSKLMNQNKVTMEAEANEFAKVDSEFQSEKSLKIEDVQILESCIQVLNGPALLVDVPRDKNITAEVMKSLHIPKGVRRVLFRTLNTDRRLMFKKEFDTSYVGFMKDGAQWLVDNTDIKLVGIDYLSVAAYDDLIPSHLVFLKGRETILVEGLKLDDVKAGLYSVHCLPLRLVGAEGSPIRCILIN